MDVLSKLGGWLPRQTIVLVRHGSRAYGTDREGSDEDFKGIAVPPAQYFLGFHHQFEQAELKEPDTVIYEIRKFFRLAAAANPNIIEILHVDPVDQLYLDPVGEALLEIRQQFLSRRVRHTFMGYAVSQLNRIRTHRKWLLSPPNGPPTRADMGLPERTVIPGDQLAAAQAEIRRQLDRRNFDFLEDLSEGTRIAVQNAMSEMLAQLGITADKEWEAAARQIGLDENFLEVMRREREYASRHTEWRQYSEWKENRNRQRYALEAKYGYDTKHAYHLVRLMRMCREILQTGQVIVKRPDREELLAIREGAWSYDQLIEFAETEDQAMAALSQSSPLPRTPDLERLDRVCAELVERAWRRA